MNIFYFVLTGVLLFFVLQLGGRVLHALARKNAFKPAVLKLFPVVELGAWIAYAFWGARVLFGNMRYYEQIIAGMTGLFVFAIAWYVFRDYFSGIMLRSEFKLELGQIIKTPVAEGRIITLGQRFIELENERGEKTRIPYAQLSNQWVSLPSDAGKSLSHHLVVQLPGPTDPAVLKEMINQAMMGMPWVIGPPPVIKISKNKDGQTLLEVSYDLLKEEHALVVEEKIRELVGQQSHS